MGKVVVVGGGPAGMLAGIRAAGLGSEVTLIEKNPILGKKLLLSGKGRCNLTNLIDPDLFLKRFSQNGAFLRDALKKFSPRDLINFFEKRGLKLNIERQLRVFPASNSSTSVLEALKKELQKNKVKIIYKAALKDIFITEGKVKGSLLSDGRVIPADKIILATGGVSYKFTGSTGEGINLAQKLGHHIIALRPGLIPLETRQKLPIILEGLTLKNIRIKFTSQSIQPTSHRVGAKNGEKNIVSDIGELLFTKFGISGPLVLSLSAKIVDWLNEKNQVWLEIDLKPALTKEQLNARLLREFKLESKKSIKNVLKNLLPKRLAEVFIDLLKIPADKKVSYITAGERNNLTLLLKSFRLDIVRALPIEEAMVTRGGISLKDINPRTMESRIIKGLYFAGEMIDVDGDTGGFNLQAAFSTGYLAGESAALN